jgi:hypothetical protein
VAGRPLARVVARHAGWNDRDEVEQIHRAYMFGRARNRLEQWAEKPPSACRFRESPFDV